jgi:hypothetical protein
MANLAVFLFLLVVFSPVILVVTLVASSVSTARSARILRQQQAAWLSYQARAAHYYQNQAYHQASARLMAGGRP